MKVEVNMQYGYNFIHITEVKNEQLDISNIKILKKKFKEILKAGNKNIAIDLKRVKYIDSSTIGFFVDALNEIRNLKGKFALVNVDKKIIEILNMTNLTKFLPIYTENDLKDTT